MDTSSCATCWERHVGVSYCSEAPKDDWTRWPNSKGKTLGLTTRGTDSFAKYLGPRTGGISAAPIFEWFFYVLLPSQNPVETYFTIKSAEHSNGKKAMTAGFSAKTWGICAYTVNLTCAQWVVQMFSHSESSTFLLGWRGTASAPLRFEQVLILSGWRPRNTCYPLPQLYHALYIQTYKHVSKSPICNIIATIKTESNV